MSLQQWLGILSALLGSVFFTSVEAAFASANQLHIEWQENRRIYSGKILSRFAKNPSGLIGTTLIGNVLALATYTVLGFTALYPYFKDILQPPFNQGVIVFSLVASLLFTAHFLLAECLTKFIFLLDSERWFQVLLVPLRVLHVLLYPLVAGITGISKWVLQKVLRVRDARERPIFNPVDLNTYIEHVETPATEKEETEVDTQIFNNALSFKSIRVRDCMVPRTEISAVEVKSDMTELKTAFVSSGHSKIIVYKGTIDAVIGYCPALELFKKPKDIASILSPIMVVPETMPVTDIFLQFTSGQKGLALVVDEYGGTSGIISLEDVVERLFGEIQDEYDTSEDWVEEKLDEHTYLLSARHEIEYLNEKYRLQLPAGEYGTLGGLIISVHQDLPPVNQRVELPPFTFTILSVRQTHVDVVKLTVAP